MWGLFDLSGPLQPLLLMFYCRSMAMINDDFEADMLSRDQDALQH